MRLGRVLGAATATIKHSSLEGAKLLVVQPCMSDCSAADGEPQLAVDLSGAGKGEMVVISSDGRGAREFLGVEATPVRWTIIGIQDDLKDEENE